MYIYNNNVYIISCNLNVKKTKYKSELNNTILEGEFIHLIDQNKYLFMVFDCLYFNNIDARDEILFKNRLDYVNKVCKDINDKILNDKIISKIY